MISLDSPVTLGHALNQCRARGLVEGGLHSSAERSGFVVEAIVSGGLLSDCHRTLGQGLGSFYSAGGRVPYKGHVKTRAPSMSPPVTGIALAESGRSISNYSHGKVCSIMDPRGTERAPSLVFGEVYHESRKNPGA